MNLSDPTVIPDTQTKHVEYRFSRQGLFTFSALLGLTIAAVIGLAVYGLIQFSHQQRQNTQQISALNRLTTRLNVLIHPTPKQFRDQLKESILRCLKEPECKKLFPRIKSTETAKEGGGSADVPVVSRRDLPPVLTSTPQTHGLSPSRGRGGTGGHGGSGNTGSSGGGNGGGAGSPSPNPTPAPTPPINVHVDPLSPSVCTPLIGVNCP